MTEEEEESDVTNANQNQLLSHSQLEYVDSSEKSKKDRKDRKARRTKLKKCRLTNLKVIWTKKLVRQQAESA